MDKTTRNKDAVTQRILETTQETERLKQELQNLIASGISGNKNLNFPTSSTNLSLESTNKVQIIKSYDPKHSQHVKKPLDGSATTVDPSGAKNEAQALSPKKVKTYDVRQARDYIKKQRDKRKEDLKSKKTDSKVAADILKEKLQELQQKASELVKKNVQAKRQRSKSRDGADKPATNEIIIEGFNCAEKTKKHLDHPTVNQPKPQVQARNPNLLYPSEPVFHVRRKLDEDTKNVASTSKINATGSVPGKTQNKHSKSLQNLTKPPEPHYVPQDSHTKPPQPHYVPQDSHLNSKSNETTDALKRKNPIQKKSSFDQCSSAIENPNQKDLLPTTHQPIENSIKTQLPSKRGDIDQSFKSANEPPLPPYSPALHKSTEIISKKQSPNKKKIIVLSNITVEKAQQIPSQADDKQIKVVTPEWLKNTVGQSDPYNFINTVKRQLKYVINEKKPSCVDVGVQGSFRDNISDFKSGHNSKKSDLKSFISHKCLNLNPQTIQHIELNRGNNRLEFNDGPTITNQCIGSDYDSDTSKNIPSISSESGTSLRRNAEIVRQSYAISDLKPLADAPPNLDTKKLEYIKLKKASKVTNSEINPSTLKIPLREDVERVRKHLFVNSDEYSSDFATTDLSRSRNDSLISFNSAKRSPNRVPEPCETKSENSRESSNSIKSDTGVVPKTHSETSDGLLQDSERKSRSLNSNTIIGAEKRYSRSAEFYSLYSELDPSASDPELKTSRHLNEAHLDDGFTEVLKPKDLFSDSNNSQKVLPNDTSDKIKTVSSLKNSEKSISDLYKSKSEQIISNKRDAGIFSKSESNIYGNKENINEMLLKEPKLSLNIKDRNRIVADGSTKQALMKNISIRSGDRSCGDMNNTNEIHLRFEAEIHLLNDFNQSLRHFAEIEKAFESLRSKNDSETMTKKVLQNRDTQTSIITKTSTRTVSKQSDRSASQISTINYSRGSGIDSEIHTDQDGFEELTRSEVNSESKLSEKEHILETTKKSDLNSEMNLLELTQGSELNDVLHTVNFEDTGLGNVSERTSSIMQLSRIDDTVFESRDSRVENVALNNFAGMSLRMFDQLIKDEDARIENWKKIVKIREQALLDRTRGELVWLEMQKKQLIETGKMPEASMIKKKQRGILLKHQQEKHEMQRLKQMQKEASAKRKTELKRERNLIKHQLLSDNMLSKLKPSSYRERNERRLSGPLKVIQATESVRSEASMTKAVAGTDQEIKSITSRTCSVVNILSATSDNVDSEAEPLEVTLARSGNLSSGAISSMRRTLLMREHALAKRRKNVEELLQWHTKLLQEEKDLKQLESKVEKIISKIPSESNEESAKQPKDLSRSVSEKTSSELNTSSMSQIALDRLLPSKEHVSSKTKSVSSEVSINIPQEENTSEDSNKVVSSANYSTDFDVESVPEVLPQNSDDQSSVSSIRQLIEDFSRIEGNILNFSLVQKKQTLESEEVDISSPKNEDVKSVSTIAEEVVYIEEKSEASSRSSQIASEIEVKKPKETASEHLQIEERADPVEGSEKSIIIVEEPSEHSSQASEENKLDSSVEIEEIATEGSVKETVEVVENSSDKSRTAHSVSENSPKSVIEELSSKELLSEVVSVSEEVKITIVPDTTSNKSSLREDVVKQIAEKQSTSVVSDFSLKKSEDSEYQSSVDEGKVPEEISARIGSGQLALGDISATEQSQLEANKDSQNIVTENDAEASESDIEEVASLKSPEEAYNSSQESDIVAEVDRENTSSVHKESIPLASHQSSIEDKTLPGVTEEDIPSTSQQFLDQESGKVSSQVDSEEPVELPSKNDVLTTHLDEYIEICAASNVEIPSTSRQTEEQGTSSQILSLTKEDISNLIEEREQDSIASISSPIAVENDLPQSRVNDEERHSSENKTDEEKVASLSCRTSVSHKGPVIEDTTRSFPSTSRSSGLVSQAVPVSQEKSSVAIKTPSRSLQDPSGSIISDKSIVDEGSAAASISGDERLTEASVTLDRSKVYVDKEVSEQDLSKASGSGQKSSVSELSTHSSIEEESLPSEEIPKIIASGKESNSEVYNKTVSKDTSEVLINEEKESVAASVEENSVCRTKSSSPEEKSELSTTKSTNSCQKSTVSSEKPSKSSITKEKSSASAVKSDGSLQKSSTTSPKSPLNVKKRVQEILNEASPVSRGDKSPRMQDLCVMTYDLISPTQSPESGSPLEEKAKSFYLGSEAEELLRKQLVIEQEIKLLTEQQQKEHIPNFYIREIPNKPPPPYTPPSKVRTPKTPSIIPSSKEQVEQITEYSAKIIHKAYLSNNLDNISISDNTLNLIAKNIDKGCYKYVFDLCKEIAIEHYGQFAIEAGPSWLRLEKKQLVAPSKPLDVKGLKKLMSKKLLELFRLEKQGTKKENAILKWSRKKRDHVDEVLVQEMQAQEISWTNFDRDELIVKDRITNEIMEMLLKETAQVLKKTVQKKSNSQ